MLYGEKNRFSVLLDASWANRSVANTLLPSAIACTSCVSLDLTVAAQLAAPPMQNTKANRIRIVTKRFMVLLLGNGEYKSLAPERRRSTLHITSKNCFAQFHRTKST